MSDRRFKENINSLVVENRRVRITPPPPRPPVPGGAGYAGLSESDTDVATNQIWYNGNLSIMQIGPPGPIPDPTEVGVGAGALTISVCDGDYYHIPVGSDRVFKNDSVLVNRDNIRAIAVNTTELFVFTFPPEDDGTSTLLVYNRDTGAFIREITGQSWQQAGIGLDGGSSPEHMRASDSRVLVPINYAFNSPNFSETGYWIYEPDFTYVDYLYTGTANGFQRYPISLTDDRIYMLRGDYVNGQTIEVYDLNKNLLDSQFFAFTQTNPHNTIEVNNAGIWLADFDTSSAPLNIAYIPRNSSGELFNLAAKEDKAVAAIAQSPFISGDRQGGLEVG